MGEPAPIAQSRWRVLPVGLGPALQRQALRASVHVMVGLGVLFGTVVVAGIVSEELLSDSEAGSTIDLAGRASLAGMLILLVLAFLALGVLGALEGPLMARALARRLDEGVPAADVPAPGQWAEATEPSARAYRIIAIVLLCVLGLVHLIVIAAMLESGIDAVGLAVIAAGLLVLGLIGAGIPLFEKVLGARQERTAQRLRAHWTEPHRIIAAGRALTAEDVAAARGVDGPEALPGAGARRLGGAALGVLGASAAVGLLALQLMFALAYPDRERWSGGRAGERAELDPRGEQLVDLVVAGVGVCGALVLLCLLLALACEVLARRAEMRAVRTALADPAAPPPAIALLRSLFAAGAPRLLLAMHSLAGALAAIGLGLWVVPIGEDGPSWEIFSSAGPTLRSLDAQAPLVLVGALMVLAAGILLAAGLDVREQRLRDELVRRWPMRADPSPAAEA